MRGKINLIASALDEIGGRLKSKRFDARRGRRSEPAAGNVLQLVFRNREARDVERA